MISRSIVRGPFLFRPRTRPRSFSVACKNNFSSEISKVVSTKKAELTKSGWSAKPTGFVWRRLAHATKCNFCRRSCSARSILDFGLMFDPTPITAEFNLLPHNMTIMKFRLFSAMACAIGKTCCQLNLPHWYNVTYLQNWQITCIATTMQFKTLINESVVLQTKGQENSGNKWRGWTQKFS